MKTRATYGAPSAAEQKKAEAASKAKARRWQAYWQKQAEGRGIVPGLIPA